MNKRDKNEKLKIGDINNISLFLHFDKIYSLVTVKYFDV